MIDEMKEEILMKYDMNFDGRLDLEEVCLASTFLCSYSNPLLL